MLTSQEFFFYSKQEILNLKLCEIQRNDCVDTTMFPLQATMFFSYKRAVFNGSVFARGVWSSFLMLDHGERWRACINLSSYQKALGRSSEGGFVLLCVSLCKCYHFSSGRALLCRQRLPFSPQLCL